MLNKFAMGGGSLNWMIELDDSGGNGFDSWRGAGYVAGTADTLGNVYFAGMGDTTSTCIVYAFDKYGELIWCRNLTSFGLTGDRVRMDTNGTNVFIATLNNCEVMALNCLTGATTWTRDLTLSKIHDIQVCGSHLVLMAVDATYFYMIQLNLSTGATTASRRFNDGGTWNPSPNSANPCQFYYDGSYYFGLINAYNGSTTDGLLFRIDTSLSFASLIMLISTGHNWGGVVDNGSNIEVIGQLGSTSAYKERYSTSLVSTGGAYKSDQDMYINGIVQGDTKFMHNNSLVSDRAYICNWDSTGFRFSTDVGGILISTCLLRNGRYYGAMAGSNGKGYLFSIPEDYSSVMGWSQAVTTFTLSVASTSLTDGGSGAGDTALTEVDGGTTLTNSSVSNGNAAATPNNTLYTI